MTNIQNKNHTNSKGRQTDHPSKNEKANMKKEANSKQHNGNNSKDEGIRFNVYILPIILIISVLPLIMRLKVYDPNMMQYTWYEDVNSRVDFFLYYKQWFLIIVAIGMTIFLLYKGIKERYKKPFEYSLTFIPLASYALLAILSTIFSDYAYFSIHGSMDQFESLFALLSYCIIIFYAFQYIKTERDIKVIIGFFLVSALVLVALGISQYVGHDFFATEKGARLITANKVGKGGLSFSFGENRVYMTLFNPNYVGVYTAMVIPVLLVLLLFSKKLINSLLYLIAIVGLFFCVAGSQSMAGLIGIAAAFAGLVVVMWRYLLRRFYFSIPVFLILLATAFLINKQTDNYMVNRVKSAIQLQKVDQNIRNITTGADKVIIDYKGNQINLSLNTENSNETYSYGFIIKDSSNNDILYNFDSASGNYVIQDERFPGFSFNQVIQEGNVGFFIKIDGRVWIFTNQLGDGSYYVLNRFNKWDKMYNQQDSILTGYEGFASRRGYLWSRTIPLLNKYIVLGSGPDTYTLAFPQNDYLGFYNFQYESHIITKPHSLYLQIAVQTGMLSLISFLMLYLIYFISSIRLYLRGRFNSYYSQVGVAILIGTSAYMVTGLTNDSSITTAPVFWCLLGIGLAANHKAKPIILEESAIIKAKREEKKAAKLAIKAAEDYTDSNADK